MLARSCSKSFKLGVISIRTENFQKYKLDLEKAEELEIKCQYPFMIKCQIIEKTREFQKNIYSCSIDYAKAFDCVNHNKLWKILFFIFYFILFNFTILYWFCHISK